MRSRGLIVILVFLFAAVGACAVATETVPDSFTIPLTDRPDEGSPTQISTPERSPTTAPGDETSPQTGKSTETTTPRLTENDQVFCDDDPDDEFDCEPGMPLRNGSTVPPDNESSSVSLDVPDADTRAGEPPGRESTWEYDMVISDQWVHWWLSNGGMGMYQSTDNDPPVVLIIEGHRAPDLPDYGPTGEVEMDTILGDVPMEYAPPGNFTWEPLPNRTYEYEFSITDQATREMLKFDSVSGISTQWVCPHSDPDCDPGDMDAGITFRVADESFAEKAPEVIEGQPIRYRVINES